MSDERKIWKRRVLLMAVIALLVAVPATVAIRGGDDADESAQAPPPRSPQLGAVKFDRKLGVELRVPDGWRRSRKGGVVSLRSPDRSALVAISAPGPADDARAIHQQAIATLMDQYRNVEVLDRIEDRKLGDRPAATAVLSARQRKRGGELRLLVSTARGEKRAYLVEVFAAGSDAGTALVEAQAVLNNLSLKG